MAKKKTDWTAKAIDSVIGRHLASLRKTGVLTVRPGYEIAGHQLTGKQAIVVTVHTKTSDLPPQELLPEQIEKIPVDVREATAQQRLRQHDPAAAAVTQAYARPEDQEPTWPFEREMPSGKPLGAATSTIEQQLARKTVLQPGVVEAQNAHASKPRLTYVPAAVPLDPITTTTTITAHVSPDAGLATLEAFLRGTRALLVIGMYDFTSGSILKTFETVLDGSKTLQMVLDNPSPNPTRDQTDTQTVQELDRTLAGRSQIARALVRSDTLVTAWMFPYAYHIKVIVRDGTAMWLSSGNLNNSNQPDLASPPSTEDRDWHVIIEDGPLSQCFAAYLNQDFASAQQHQIAARTEISDTVSDAFAKLAAEANPPPALPLVAAAAAPLVPAKVFQNASVKIIPLLTPDPLASDPTKGQYLTNIIQLISRPRDKLYIQLQYIEASKEAGDYQTLLQAIADRVTAGVTVRLIQSRQYGEKWAEMMKSTGVDLTANIYLQPNVHNKGFVVDSKTVVVSSQNFSPAGIRHNRDAGVIIENADIAQYFEAIFVSDLTTKAKAFAPQEAGGPPSTGGHKKKAAVKKTPVKKPTTKKAKKTKAKTSHAKKGPAKKVKQKAPKKKKVGKKK